MRACCRFESWPIVAIAIAWLSFASCKTDANRPESDGRQERQVEVARLLTELSQRPDDASTLVSLGTEYWKLGELDQAATTLQRALTIVTDADIAFNLVQILYSRGRYVEASQFAGSITPGVEPQPQWFRELRDRFDSVMNVRQTVIDPGPLRPINGVVTNSVGMPLVHVAGGTFIRGDDRGDADRRPGRSITVSPFFMGQFEVTFDQFKRFVQESAYPYDPPVPELFDNRFNSYPAAAVSWLDAQAFTMWLSAREHAIYRLPTEAEWEFAARGLQGFREPWGNNQGAKRVDGNWGLVSVAELSARIPAIRPVGSFSHDRSPFGVFDMAGNVKEWCLDEYDSTYYAWSPSRNPYGPVSNVDGIKVLRGASWNDPGRRDFAIRRGSAAANQPYTGFGFRVVREVTDPEVSGSRGK